MSVSGSTGEVLAIVAKLESESWLARLGITLVTEVSLSEVKDDLCRFLRESENIVVTRHDKPTGVLIGFEFEADWFDVRLEHDPTFWSELRRRERASLLVVGSNWKISIDRAL